MKIAFACVLAAACTSTSPTDKVVPPDNQVFATLYPTAAGVQETPPFTLDLGACAFAKHEVALGGVEPSSQFALAHVNDRGECEVWVGYDSMVQLHADLYCAFPPSGTIDVVQAATSGGGCGGPPGTLPLTIQSPSCVTLSQ
jgi:hypothetical protein